MRINVSPPALMAGAVMFYLDREGIFPLFLLAAAIHEGAHLLVLSFFEGRLPKNSSMSLGIFGSQIFTGFLSPLKEAAAIAAGPASNLLIYLVLALMARHRLLPEQLPVFAGINLVLGCYNLLPVLCLDGGRLTQLALESFLSFETAAAICLGLSFVVIALMGCLGLLVSYRYGAGFALVLSASWLALKHSGWRQCPSMSFRAAIGGAES